jgi:predicted aspartyl protease
MKALSDSARTTQAFFKIAKDEEELLDENVPEPHATAPYVPYFANTVSITNDTSSMLRTPIYINVQINNKQHQVIVDTGSAVTIINQQLLKKIYHTDFVFKTRNDTNQLIVRLLILLVKLNLKLKYKDIQL